MRDLRIHSHDYVSSSPYSFQYLDKIGAAYFSVKPSDAAPSNPAAGGMVDGLLGLLGVGGRGEGGEGGGEGLLGLLGGGEGGGLLELLRGGAGGGPGQEGGLLGESHN